MITRSEILKGQTCPLNLERNLAVLLDRLNIIRGVWGKPMIITSGYRNPEKNASIGGAKNSAHLFCQAADISDPKGDLGEWLLQNQEVLEEVGLWMEAPHKTNTSRGRWIHLQSRPANNRVFEP